GQDLGDPAPAAPRVGACGGLAEVADGVAGQRLEVGPEAPRRVVAERGQAPDEPGQDRLDGVLDVGLLEAGPPAPGPDPRRVAADEPVPGLPVAGVDSELLQQRQAG